MGDALDIYFDVIDSQENLDLRRTSSLASASSTLAILSGLCGIVANIITLVGISKIPGKLDSHYILITNLCTADLLIGTLFLMRYVLDNVHSMPNVMFHIAHLLCGIFYCTIFTIMALAINHYIAILKTQLYESWFSRPRCIGAVIGIWILSMLLMSIIFIGSSENSIANGIYTICAVVLLALVILLYSYINIFKHWVNIQSNPVSDDFHSQGSMAIKYRAAMTTVWILASFVITWIPLTICLALSMQYYHGGNLLQLKSLDIMNINAMGMFFILLPSVNAVCDPVICIIRLKKIRHGIQKACGCCDCCKKVQDLEQ